MNFRTEKISLAKSFILLLVLLLGGSAYGELLAYEGFDYSRSPLGNQDGGYGWKDGWYGAVSPPNLTGASNLDLNLSDSIQPPASYDGGLDGFFFTNPLLPLGGSISVPTGLGGAGYRRLAHSAELNLNSNQNYYISYSFKRNDEIDTGTNEWTSFSLGALEGNDFNHIIQIVSQSDESWAINMKDSTLVATDRDAFSLNTPYFIVVKIAAQDDSSQDNRDRIFLKVYDCDTPVEISDIGFEDTDWTLISNQNQNYSVEINVLGIYGATETGYAFDEIRIGTTWSSVVEPAPNCCNDIEVIYREADVNRDTYVDFADFVEIASQWLQCIAP